jgi:hypothetical protein
METKNAPKTRYWAVGIALLAFVALAVSTTIVSKLAFAQKAGKKTKMDTPTLECAGSTASSISIRVTAGATGAPAGFSIQWMTKADFDAYGWPVDSGCPLDVKSLPTCAPSFCKASFSGNANASSYNLGPGLGVVVQIGDTLFDDPGASSTCPSTPLRCGTTYVFRAFAHANSSLQRSEFTGNLDCKTLNCSDNGGCTYTQGYWKTHGPIPTGNNSNEWPVTGLTLGTVNYTDLQLQSIFNTPAAGNGLISLAHQLIAAKLNVANGADDSAVAGAIAAADALIGGLVVPPVGTGSLANGATSALTGTLTSFNEGAIGPGHCPE